MSPFVQQIVQRVLPPLLEMASTVAAWWFFAWLSVSIIKIIRTRVFGQDEYMRPASAKERAYERVAQGKAIDWRDREAAIWQAGWDGTVSREEAKRKGDRLHDQRLARAYAARDRDRASRGRWRDRR